MLGVDTVPFGENIHTKSYPSQAHHHGCGDGDALVDREWVRGYL